MSEIIVRLENKPDGFTRVYVDDKHCGNVEDPDGDFSFVLKHILDYMGCENFMIHFVREMK